jgi:hypothetical protein
MYTPSRHAEIALYADDTALKATTREVIAPCQVPEDIPRQTSALAMELEDCYQRLKEH